MTKHDDIDLVQAYAQASLTAAEPPGEKEIEALHRLRLAYERGDATHQEVMDALARAHRVGAMPSLADIHKLLKAVTMSAHLVSHDIRNCGWAADGENLAVGAALEGISDQIRMLENVQEWFVLAAAAFEAHKPRSYVERKEP